MSLLHPAPRKRPDLVFDVGFHRGEDARFFLRKGFRVVAFEALPELVREAREVFSEEIASGRLTLVEGAIVARESLREGAGVVTFYRNESVSVWGTANPSWVVRNERKGTASTRIEVPAIDFRAAIQEHGVPHYLKIDIEGSDVVCLRCLVGLPEHPDYVSLESCKTSFTEVRREIELLESLGYDRFQAVEQSEIPVTQVPPMPAREGVYAPHVFEEGCSGLFGAELGGAWMTKRDVLRRYRHIYLGYRLLGDDGIMNRWRFRGADRLRRLAARAVRQLTGGPVPGWYDTHARHASAASAPLPGA